MSADNWRVCPRCKRETQKKRAAARKKVDAAYGKVSVDQFLQMKAKAEADEDAGLEKSLREDYELGVDEDGSFSVSYSGACSECGFRFSFEHKEDVKA